MLTRTVSKHPKRSEYPARTWWILGCGVVIIVGILVAFRPWSVRRVRDLPMPEDQVRETALSLMLTDGHMLTSLESKKAALGRTLFRDQGLSGNGQTSCTSCHIPEKFFSDGSPYPVAGPLAGTDQAALLPHTPALGNGRLQRWANWDGSRDSLAAQALHSLEDPRIMGASRVHVVRHVMASHREAYEEAFGPLPAILREAHLPVHGLSGSEVVTLPLETASYGLATLSGKGLLLEILVESQKKRIAPATELSRRVLDFSVPDSAWVQAYEALGQDVKSAVEQTFIKVGQALSAYQRQIVSTPSRFDRFAARLAAGDTIAQAMDVTSFSETELTGFKLFIGPGGCVQCHSGPGLSDQKFHNIGLPYNGGPLLMGRAVGALVALNDRFNCFSRAFPSEMYPTNDDTERCPTLGSIEVSDKMQVGALKTPSLRNVAMTAPYMHDGRFATLDQVLEAYSYFEVAPAIGERDPLLTPLRLTDEEKEALAAFMATLASPLRDLGAEPKLSLLE